MGSLKVTPWILAYREVHARPTPQAAATVARLMENDHSHGDTRRSSSSGRIRPSMVGGPCVRAMTLAYDGHPSTPSRPEWAVKATAGSWLHYSWQADLLSGFVDADGRQRDPLATQVEVQVSWEPYGYPQMRGSADGLLDDGSLLEIKTLGHDRFVGTPRLKGVDAWATPKADHLMQVNAYMHGVGADEASVVYVDRDTNDFLEFRIRKDPELIEEIARRCERIVDGSDRSVMLDGCVRTMDGMKVPWAERMDYEFCSYRDACASSRVGSEAS